MFFILSLTKKAFKKIQQNSSILLNFHCLHKAIKRKSGTQT